MGPKNGRKKSAYTLTWLQQTNFQIRDSNLHEVITFLYSLFLN